ncbi:hypothetical protein SLE2022_292600 [Rubroshorea leprosula]
MLKTLQANMIFFCFYIEEQSIIMGGLTAFRSPTPPSYILGQPDSAPGREPINATDPNTLYAMHLDRQPAFIQDHINDLDVLVLNTAHHWSLRMVNMDKEIMYLNGKPLKDKNLRKIESAKIFKVNSILSNGFIHRLFYAQS